ncbi:MAG: MoaD/ThiS family protein [Deltaproteobacteria bacterium]|nr:MoaD/ThiS family protein [Deltaproteobacteria bacterium]
MLNVKVKYFALYQELKSKKEEEIVLSEPIDIKTLFFKLMEEVPLKEQYFMATLCACNYRYVSAETIIQSGDEIAFIPPIAGG